LQVEDADGAKSGAGLALICLMAAPLFLIPGLYTLARAWKRIYVFKAAQLADAIGWDAMRGIIPSIVPSIAWATRYDKLPEMRKYTQKLRGIDHMLPSLARRQKHPNESFDSARFRNDVLFGKNDAAFEAVHGALTAGVHVDVVAQELVLAASDRILRMDLEWEVSHDERVWDEGGWLEVTHLLTHANANRQMLRRGVTPEALRSLYHSAWFINWQKRFDRADGARADIGPLPEPETADAEELAAAYRSAVTGERPEEAMGIVRAWSRAELPDEELLTSSAARRRSATTATSSASRTCSTSHAAMQNTASSRRTQRQTCRCSPRPVTSHRRTDRAGLRHGAQRDEAREQAAARAD
jgi:hypothetical protein